jgi:hypothetical protein
MLAARQVQRMVLGTGPPVRGVWLANSGGFPGVALGRIARQDGKLKVGRRL